MQNQLDTILFGANWNENWHMTASERAIFIQALQRLKPDVSLEIGTFLCGSLRPIAHFSRHVISLDIDANQHRISSLFPTVEFITGDSGKTLPLIIQRLNRSEEEELNFILIDGSHEVQGVRSDIAACLDYRPKRTPTVILMHDSSNSKVREGIATAPWDTCPYVHELNLDLCPGALYDRVDIQGQIWGGLAGALLLPVQRQGELVRQAWFEPSLAAMLASASYKGSDPPR